MKANVPMDVRSAEAVKLSRLVQPLNAFEPTEVMPTPVMEEMLSSDVHPSKAPLPTVTLPPHVIKYSSEVQFWKAW